MELTLLTLLHCVKTNLLDLRIGLVCKEWSQSKMLLGCAMYILKGPSIVSLCLQKSDCNIVYSLKKILKV